MADANPTDCAERDLRRPDAEDTKAEHVVLAFLLEEHPSQLAIPELSLALNRACGLSRRAVYRAIARGELRAARLCHRLRIHSAELERWIAAETHGASPPPPRCVRRRVSSAEGGLRVLLDEGAEG